jgi:hypothetical protein
MITRTHNVNTSIRAIMRGMTLALALLMLNGCVGLSSVSLPPRLSDPDRARLQNAHISLTVGVETNAVGGDVVISHLQRTKLFDAVDFVDRLPVPPQVLAKRKATPYGTATIPVRTLLTFGLLPTVVPEPYGFGCTFYSPRNQESGIGVEYLYTSQTTLGWVAGPLALSPNTVLAPRSPDQHPRFTDHMILKILDHAEALLNLANDTNREPNKTNGR